jgi:hypothetical protein
MEPLEVLITLPLRKQRTCGCYYGNCFGKTTADTIAESNETFTIASGTASATGTINDNDAAQLYTITPASATEGSPVFEFSLSNPSALQSYTHSPMELLEVLITLPHQTVSVPGATTGT